MDTDMTIISPYINCVQNPDSFMTRPRISTLPMATIRVQLQGQQLFQQDHQLLLGERVRVVYEAERNQIQ